MSGYLDTVKFSVVTFPILAGLITIPFVLYQYHKFGAIPWFRTLIVYTFVFYLLTCYYLIVLPLPDPSNTALFSYSKHVRLIPFNNLQEYFLKHGFTLSLAYMKRFFTSSTFFQLTFNVLMCMPFGIYLRYYFKASLKKTFLATFLLSLFFECTQLSGIYGYYPGPYRTFDADDLITNTLGGILGWLTAPLCTFFLPRRRQLDVESVEASERVTFFRRAISDLIDGVLCFLMVVAGEIVYVTFTGKQCNVSTFAFGTMVIGLLCFESICTAGSTPGKAFLHLKIVSSKSGTTNRIYLLLRYFLLLSQLVGTQVIIRLLYPYLPTTSGLLKFGLNCMIALCWGIFLLFFLESIKRIFHSEQPYLYESLSNTCIRSTFKEKQTGI